MCGGGGGSVKYDELERLYAIQARQAESLMDQANQNVYPVYNQLLEDSKNSGSMANQEAAAGRAAADMLTSGEDAKQRAAADLVSLGVNPNDQKWANTVASIDLDTAARSAAAQSGARSYVRDLSFAKTTDLVNAGMGIGSNAVAALNSAGGMAGNIAGLQQQGQANRDANLGNIAALGTRLMMNRGGLVPKKFSDGDGLPRMVTRQSPGSLTASRPTARAPTQITSGNDGSGDGASVGGENFDGGLLDAIGLGTSGNEIGNNGGRGLGLAEGGPDVSMNSAAGNAGDNSVEMDAIAATNAAAAAAAAAEADADADSSAADAGGMTGMDGNGGGFGGDSGDGYACGGRVRKYAMGGRVRGGITGAMQAINPAPPPPSTRTASPVARAGQQAVTGGGAPGAGKAIETVGNLVGKVAPEAGNSISSFGAGLRLGEGAQPAIEAYQAAATGAEAAGTAAAGAEAATAAAGATEAAGAAAAGAEAAGATATAMGAGSAIGTALSAAMPWVGGAMLIGSMLDLFADGGQVKSKAHKIGGQQGPDGVAENETGGKVDGPGGPKEDKVLARLSPEEFVMPVATVKLYGLERLEKMRQLGLRHEKQLGIR